MNKGELADVIDGLIEAESVVRETFGPNGSTVIIKRAGSYHPTKDGITVLSSLRSENKSVQLGIDMLRDASLEANKIAGDGSTTTTILTSAFLRYMLEGSEGLDGRNRDIVNNVRKGIEEAKNTLIAMAKPILGRPQMKDIAMVSSNGDVLMSDLIADAFHKLGGDASISVEPVLGGDTTIEYVEGFKLETLITSKAFMDKTGQSSKVMKEYLVVPLHERIRKIEEIKKYFVSKEPVLFIAHQIDPDVMRSLINNHVLGKIDVNVVKYPQTTEFRKGTIEDLESMLEPKKYMVSINDTTTTIMGLKRSDEAMDREVILKAEIESCSDEGIKSYLEKRLANLQGKACIIKAGGETEAQINELADRIEDTINAVRAAIKQGYIAGAGVGLMTALMGVQSGYPVIGQVLSEPYNILKEQMDLSDSTQELIDKGVIDPVLVSLTAIDKAFAVASTLFQSSSIIIKDTYELD